MGKWKKRHTFVQMKNLLKKAHSVLCLSYLLPAILIYTNSDANSNV